MESYNYAPSLFHPLTYVGQTYPEHHLPFVGARQRVAQVVQDIFSPSIDTRSPRTDIRETVGRYYIDVELPGVTSVHDVSISWSNPRVLVVKATIGRTPTAEETESRAAGDAPAKDSKHHHPVHYLSTERELGTLMRAFDFAVDVDHDSLKAKLHGGLVSIIVEKKPHEDLKHKEVKIEHTDEHAGMEAVYWLPR